MKPIDMVFPGQVLEIPVPKEPVTYTKDKDGKPSKVMVPIRVKVVAVHAKLNKFDYKMDGDETNRVFANYEPTAPIKVLVDVPRSAKEQAKPEVRLIDRIKVGGTVHLTLPSFPPAYEGGKRTSEVVECEVVAINRAKGTIDYIREDDPKVTMKNLVVTADNCTMDGDESSAEDKPLSEMTKKQLLARAEEMGVKLKGTENKAEIIKAIEAK